MRSLRLMGSYLNWERGKDKEVYEMITMARKEI